jgi:phosphoribosyl-ATP pyrophosphohydrolase/phosphoribosyl-AMP cyclohydrolase
MEDIWLMSIKKIIPYINAENELADKVVKLAMDYYYNGADELFIYNYSKDEKSREEFISLIKAIIKDVDIPVIIGTYVKRLEDVKKALYTGACAVMLKNSILENEGIYQEAVQRFGSDKIIVELNIDECRGEEGSRLINSLNRANIATVMLKHVLYSGQLIENISKAPGNIIIRDSLTRNDISNLLSIDKVVGVATNFYENKSIIQAKQALKAEGIAVNVFESSMSFSEFKLNSDGLIPVITVDYRSGKVLMLAYMNEEAYNKTITSGRMTYYSRSRQCLWIKGESSGHYQYVKELTIDCDKDTILAKVLQIGPACHTGSESCFYTELVKKEYKNMEPLHVLEDVYKVIADRKLHPKEGSYTNYLFDKGIDKILKKCGEEAIEITIAAKNPGNEELRYEIADYLYHLMVLMVECKLDWNDIITELANRR